jgi:hypothetical protein
MAAAIALKDSTCARGAADSAALSGFSAGRTVIVYVNGNYAGVKSTGPHDTQTTWGAVTGQVGMPSANPSGAQPVAAVDGTDQSTKATTTVTLT